MNTEAADEIVRLRAENARLREALTRLAEREKVDDTETGEQAMVKVDGKTFRCDCGCNVFTVIGRLRYRCNSCQALWIGKDGNALTPPATGEKP